MKRVLGLIAMLGIAACSASTASSAPDSTNALVALDDNEILGEIQYGATQTVDVTPTPKYRAFWFNGTRGDEVQITVTALDATDPVVWLTDDQFNNIASNNDAKPTDTSSLISGEFLPKTGKYFVVFREVYNAPVAKFAVSVRQLGVLPADCDPDDEGMWDSSCTDPLDYDPFDPNSCAGDDLTAAQMATTFKGTIGIKPNNGAVYFQTRQCSSPDSCSDWVYAYAMDAEIATIQAAADGSVTFANSAKTSITTTIAPAAATKACVAGPFASNALQSLKTPAWSSFTDGTAGICTTALTGAASKVTATCARFQLPTIQLGAGDTDHYTEFNPVLYAQY